MAFITLEENNNIGRVTISRPPVNAFNYIMYQELKEVFEEIEKNNDIRVVIICAEGRFFSAGNDVNDFAQSDSLGNDYGDMVEAGLGAVIQSKKPVISAVQGIAVGSGFCVASYSDIVLATPAAKFGITEVKVGIIGGAPEASYSLPPKIVRYMALTGERITAQQAREYGMVLEVVEQDQLLNRAEEIAQCILGNPPLTVQFMKESLSNIYEPHIIAKKIEFDGQKTAKSTKTEDFKEAVNAFLEKRKPIYKAK